MSKQTRSPSSSTTPLGHWNNASDANADGGAAAYCAIASGTGLYMDHYNFGFSIPSGVDILGIEVKSDLYETLGCLRERFDFQLSWNGGANWTTAKSVTNSVNATEATKTVGSPTDTWGRTWTDTEINSNTNFRVRTTLATFSSCIDLTTYHDDWVRIIVYYRTKITKSLQYVIFIPTVNIQKSLKYSVLKAVPITKSLRYTVMPYFSIQKTLRYAIRTTYVATNQKQLRYEILLDHAITKSLAYAVKSPNAVSRSLTYEINQQTRINSVGLHRLSTHGRPAVLATKRGTVNVVDSVKKDQNMVQSKKDNTVV